MKAHPILALWLALSGCHLAYDAPPQATIVGLVDGRLTDASANVIIAWHESIDPATLDLKIVRFDTDVEGNLLPDAPIFFHHALGNNDKGTGVFNDDETTLTIDMNNDLAVATQLAVVIEPGLSDLRGNTWDVQQILKFSYSFLCDASDPQPTTFPPQSVQFMLADVELPVGLQLQIFADLRVDPETGEFVGQFTNADRDPGISCAPYGLFCKPEEVCRTLPSPACVVPSERASTVDDYPDYTFNTVPPEGGYSFTIEGCIRDQQDGSFVLGNFPADFEVENPQIKTQGIEFNLTIAPIEQGVYRSQGSFKAQQVFLCDGSNCTALGPGVGGVLMRDVPADEVPEGLPPPPHLPGE